MGYRLPPSSMVRYSQRAAREAARAEEIQRCGSPIFPIKIARIFVYPSTSRRGRKLTIGSGEIPTLITSTPSLFI